MRKTIATLTLLSTSGCVSYGEWKPVFQGERTDEFRLVPTRSTIRAAASADESSLVGSVRAHPLCVRARFAHKVVELEREKRHGVVFDVLWGASALTLVGLGGGLGYAWAREQPHEVDGRLGASLASLGAGLTAFTFGPSTFAGPPTKERGVEEGEAVSGWAGDEEPCGDSRPLLERTVLLRARFGSDQLTWEARTDEAGEFSIAAARTVRQVAAFCGPPRVVLEVDQTGVLATTRGSPDQPESGELAAAVTEIEIEGTVRANLGDILSPAREVAAKCGNVTREQCVQGLPEKRAGFTSTCGNRCGPEAQADVCTSRREQCSTQNGAEPSVCDEAFTSCLEKLGVRQSFDACVTRCVESKERQTCPPL